jgi:S-adenosylmethionine:tRNA ribosyltransferase-isomerase
MIKTEEFSYSLPKRFIAQNPVSPRDSSKLLVFDAFADKIVHEKFHDIGKFLKRGDVLVINVSRVIPARIVFYENEHSREIFILKDLGGNKYQAMVKPGRIFKIGRRFDVTSDVFAVVRDILEDGTRIMEFVVSGGQSASRDDSSILNKIGEIPFPPYVTNTSAQSDQYQTVYAKSDGSIAAPTAGLHFTPRLMSELKNKGIDFEEVILHVNRGTFLPVKSEFVHEHKMHSEVFSLDKATAERLNRAKMDNRRIIAVGTTSVRVLESCYDFRTGFTAKTSDTDIFIYPGNYAWKATDGLITNFHLPKSTLLMLVASFLENKGVKKPISKLLYLYELAKKENYRFYSFGDAMFII